jgi:hypothetical protein
MKKILLPVSIIAMGVIIMSNTSTVTSQSGDCTGSPLSNGTTCYSCHNTGATRPITIMFATELGGSSQVTSFKPGKQYTITITSAQPTALFPKFGFQVCALNSDNVSAGTFTAATTGATLVSKNGISYVEHGSPITTSGMTARIQMNWTAPATNKSVTFYAAMLHSNGYGNKEGDIPSHPESLTLTANTTGLDEVNNLSDKIKLYPNPTTTSLTLELPQQAQSAQVLVRDLTGKLLYKNDAVTGKQVINTSGFAKGTYLLQVTSGGHNGTKLFSVK